MQQLLVIRRLMFFVKAGGESKISQFDVAAPVKKNIIGFDITARNVSLGSPLLEGKQDALPMYEAKLVYCFYC